MEASTLLTELRDAGAAVTRTPDGRLSVQGIRLTEAQRSAIQATKAAILDELARESRAQTEDYLSMLAADLWQWEQAGPVESDAHYAAALAQFETALRRYEQGPANA